MTRINGEVNTVKYSTLFYLTTISQLGVLPSKLEKILIVSITNLDLWGLYDVFTSTRVTVHRVYLLDQVYAGQ